MRFIEHSDVYMRSCKLADETALQVHEWTFVAQKTVGIQLVTSLDSIGANLVEGDGRGPGSDSVRFWRYSRASAREARHWFQRAQVRGYLNENYGSAGIQELTEIVLMIQGLIRNRESRGNLVREEVATYNKKSGIGFEAAFASFDDEDSLLPSIPYSLKP